MYISTELGRVNGKRKNLIKIVNSKVVLSILVYRPLSIRPILLVEFKFQVVNHCQVHLSSVPIISQLLNERKI